MKKIYVVALILFVQKQECDLCTDSELKILCEDKTSTFAELLWRVCIDAVFLFQKFQLFLLLLRVHLLESL